MCTVYCIVYCAFRAPKIARFIAKEKGPGSMSLGPLFHSLAVLFFHCARRFIFRCIRTHGGPSINAVSGAAMAINNTMLIYILHACNFVRVLIHYSSLFRRDRVRMGGVFRCVLQVSAAILHYAAAFTISIYFAVNWVWYFVWRSYLIWASSWHITLSRVSPVMSNHPSKRTACAS